MLLFVFVRKVKHLIENMQNHILKNYYYPYSSCIYLYYDSYPQFLQILIITPHSDRYFWALYPGIRAFGMDMVL